MEKMETHRVAGVSFYQDNIESLAEDNPEYDYTKREMVDNFLTDVKVWEYIFFPKNIEFIPEPDNPNDPNAIKVMIDGVQVGYIKKGSTSRIKNLLKKDLISRIDAEIGGGKYKYVYEDDDEKYQMEKGKTDCFYISLTVYIKDDKTSESVKEAPQNHAEKAIEITALPEPQEVKNTPEPQAMPAEVVDNANTKTSDTPSSKSSNVALFFLFSFFFWFLSIIFFVISTLAGFIFLAICYIWFFWWIRKQNAKNKLPQSSDDAR